jgi:hypothetical protein
MKSWPVGLVGGLLASAYITLVIGTSNWNPTVMLTEGVKAPEQLRYAEGILDAAVEPRPELGHDGKFFFILANDPWLLNPQAHASFLDLPTYRAQRMLYPLLAGGFGLAPGVASMWGLIAVNVLAAGVGSMATAALAQLLGTTRWLGLAFVVNPGVIAELDISGSGVLALALGLAALLFLLRGHSGWATSALVGSVMARETMYLLAVGIFLWMWRKRKVLQPSLLIVPALAAGLWRVYTGIRLKDVETGAVTAEGFFRNFDPVPLRGAIEASGHWMETGAKALWILCLLALLILFARRAWKSPSALAWSSWPFAVLSVFLSVLVWLEPYDIARAIAPIFITYPILLFAKRPTEQTMSVA